MNLQQGIIERSLCQITTKIVLTCEHRYKLVACKLQGKERKGTLFKCLVVLAGALIGDTVNNESKSSQMLVFEERGNWSTQRKPLGAE